jgi:hypothetical protein
MNAFIIATLLINVAVWTLIWVMVPTALLLCGLFVMLNMGALVTLINMEKRA